MNEEELTYRIPNNQIHISKEKDEDCLIWISSKAINMANTIEELQQENKQLKNKLKGVQEERDYLFNKQSIENKYLALENKELKEVIEEVRGYILNHELVEEKDHYVLNGNELLQILDKAK